jgi:hypothetical protein
MHALFVPSPPTTRRLGRRSVFLWCSSRRSAFRSCFLAGFVLIFGYCAKLLVRAAGAELDSTGHRLPPLAATPSSLAKLTLDQDLGPSSDGYASKAARDTGFREALVLPELPPHLQGIAKAAFLTIRSGRTGGGGSSSSALKSQATPKQKSGGAARKRPSAPPRASVAGAGADAGADAGVVAAARPNLVLIVLDGAGGHGDRTGLHDQRHTAGPPSHTPFLDELAPSALRLTRWAFPSQVAGCAPGRAALLTGRYGARTSVTRPLPPATR